MMNAQSFRSSEEKLLEWSKYVNQVLHLESCSLSALQVFRADVSWDSRNTVAPLTASTNKSLNNLLAS